MQRVLILGGTGCIGRSVAADLSRHTAAQITLAGRSPRPRAPVPAGMAYQPLDLRTGVAAAIAPYDLIVHCAGPFRYRDQGVLKACIDQGIAYIDVADSPDYVRAALAHHGAAQVKGVPCVLSTGVFPGISNSLVRLGIEQFDWDGAAAAHRAEAVHLSYVVAGSGGAGLTVMRTTFLELQTPFRAKVDGVWQEIAPYGDREVLPFPAPYNCGAGVYWYSTVEAMVLPESFPQLRTCITKFGSVPDFYNRLTALMTQLPQGVLQQPRTVEFLAQVSYAMTQMSDRFTGVGIALRLAITGTQAGRPATYLATLTHPDTAQIAGMGTGGVAEQVLRGQIKPGVQPVERALDTPAFRDLLTTRQLSLTEHWSV